MRRSSKSFSSGTPDWFFAGSIFRTVRLQDAALLDFPRSSVQLIVTSPPDLSETSYTHWAELFDLYSLVLEKCLQCLRPSGVVCVVLTDRKWKGTIVRKHERITQIAESLNMELFAHKIVVRTRAVSLYRIGFSHVLCFRCRDRSRQTRGRSANLAAFQVDVWGPYPKFCTVPKTSNSFPPEVAKLLVETFSCPGEMVVDPFCGIGTTQRVALGMRRRCVGYETNSRLRGYWSPLPGF
jgi:DNA modification methylase